MNKLAVEREINKVERVLRHIVHGGEDGRDHRTQENKDMHDFD